MVKTVEIRKDSEKARAQIIIDEAKISTMKITSADSITARQLIESIAYKNNLPLAVSLEKDTIKIVPDANNADTKNEVLKKYPNLMNFLTTISSLPYSMEYNTYCIGEDCPAGFEMSINLKGNI